MVSSAVTAPGFFLSTFDISAGNVWSMAVEELELDAIASETGFSGVVRVDRGDRVEIVKAYGLAHRGYDIPNKVDTRFALASGTKGLTALTVVSLVEDGALQLTTTARSVLGKDIPLVGDGVTVEHLLAHRSGIGDYLDEELGLDLDEYLMPVPVHELATTEDYLAVLDGHPRSSRPASALRIAIAAMSCSRSSPSARPALRSTSSWSAASASARGCPTPRSCARTRSGSNGSWLPRGQRHVEDKRLPSARPRIGRRRHLLDRS